MRFRVPAEITRDYRSFKRFLVILETTASYGFYDLAEQIHPLKRRLRPDHALAGRSRPEKLRMLFEELGPTFIKLGQILSTRSDLISAEYARELAKLTEKVSPFPLEKVREIIRCELGKEPEEIFREFSPEPLAAASIGQVHAAVLNDGTAVVVKVRRPGADELIATDLEIMFYIARKLENFNASLARLRPVRIVEEFAYSLRRELNYQFEAANLLRFSRNMAGSEGLVIPRLYLDCSTTRVLTMERIFGDSAAKVLADGALAGKYDLPRIAERGVNSLLSQIFEYGFFHADPHPGNIFLLEPDRFAFIDFGMMGRVSEEERQAEREAYAKLSREEKDEIQKAEELRKKAETEKFSKIDKNAPTAGFGRNPARDNGFWNVSQSQQDRVVRDMIQEELNEVAGKTICRDFSSEKEGFTYFPTDRGGIRYENGLEKETEFAGNIQIAEILAKKEGYYVELRDRKILEGNRQFDAWLNGMEKVEFKNLTSKRKETLADEIRKGISQASSLVVRIKYTGQIKPLVEKLHDLSDEMIGRYQTRQIKIIYGDDIVTLSRSDLKDKTMISSKVFMLYPDRRNLT